MPVKDVHELGVFRTKLDVCGYRGTGWLGVRKLDFFADVVDEYDFFFFVSSLSAFS